MLATVKQNVSDYVVLAYSVVSVWLASSYLPSVIVDKKRIIMLFLTKGKVNNKLKYLIHRVSLAH